MLIWIFRIDPLTFGHWKLIGSFTSLCGSSICRKCEMKIVVQCQAQEIEGEGNSEKILILVHNIPEVQCGNSVWPIGLESNEMEL